VDRWCQIRGLPRGNVISLEQGWQLADAWYHDRPEPKWRRKTPEEVAQTFATVGLSGAFWEV